jgi:hypothetical protein
MPSWDAASVTKEAYVQAPIGQGALGPVYSGCQGIKLLSAASAS